MALRDVVPDRNCHSSADACRRLCTVRGEWDPTRVSGILRADVDPCRRPDCEDNVRTNIFSFARCERVEESETALAQAQQLVAELLAAVDISSAASVQCQRQLRAMPKWTRSA